MNYNDIVARIQKGESVENIASEMTAMLNKAQEEIKAQEAAKFAAEEKDAKLDAIAAKVAEALQEYLTLMDIEVDGLTGAEVRELLDEFVPLFEQIKNLTVKVEKTSGKSADDVFSKWFKLMNW